MTGQELFDKYRRLWTLLPPPFNWVAIALVCGSIVGTILEVLGIALLGLLLGELGSLGSGVSAQWARIPHFLGGYVGSTDRIMVVLLLCGLTFFCKNLVLAWLAWLEASFAFRLQAWISQRLVGESLNLSYEEAVKRSPSEYTALLTADLSSLVLHTLLPTLTLLSELALVVGMFAYLAWTQTTVTLVVSAVLLVCGAAMAGTSRSMVSHLGLRRQVLEDSRVRQLQQTFGNLRDVYVYGAARRMNAGLASDMSELARVYRGYHMMATGPRFLLELAMVIILLAMIAVDLRTQDRGVLVASVGVFAASGFRFLIGANRIIMSVQSLRFGDAAFGRVWAAIGGITESRTLPGDAPLGGEVTWLELRARAVEYRHAAAQRGVGPVEMRVRRGEMVGIAGASGIGKSTLLELLAGLRMPQAGSVELLDAAGTSARVTEPGARISLVGQSTAILAASLKENIAFGMDPDALDDADVWEALKLAQMDEFARSLPRQLDTPLAEYGANFSGGQLQRLGIARALCRRSSFMLLDEPTSALDPATEADLVRTLRGLTPRCGIVLVSHRPGPLRLCDRVYELRPGGLLLVRHESQDFPT